MKITDQYDPTLRQVKGSAKPAKSDRAKGEKSGAEGDKVKLSNRSKEFAKAAAVVETSPEVRTEKVDSLKAKVNSGEYKIDPDQVAQKMVEEHLSELV
jgi:negative regulator of flagellin synthesis FlgM